MEDPHLLLTYQPDQPKPAYSYDFSTMKLDRQQISDLVCRKVSYNGEVS